MSIYYWDDLMRQGYNTAYSHFSTLVTVLIMLAELFVCRLILGLRS
ncbi:MAG: hypothetical protein WHT07_00020 [Desulfobaccales bacterium]